MPRGALPLHGTPQVIRVGLGGLAGITLAAELNTGLAQCDLKE
jgi:hypothetical protein